MTDLITSLNWRQVLVHLIATVLLTLGIEQIAFLTDIEFTEELTANGVDIVTSELANPVERMILFLTWTTVLEIVGLIISTFLMIKLSFKSRFSWVNTALTLLIAIALFRFGLVDRQTVKQVAAIFGRPFSSFGLLYVYVINGLILTTLGLIVFYSRWTRNIIIRAD